MTTFEGQRLTVSEMLALHTEQTHPQAHGAPITPVHHTAATNAEAVAQQLRAGDSLSDAWRYGILQTLDDYHSSYKRGGVEFASAVFADEPQPTGAIEIDAAFAALADYLAHQDHWPTPAWAKRSWRQTQNWYPAVMPTFRATARKDSPPEFRSRGIYITRYSLLRA